MGADLIACYAWAELDKPLDFAAGLALVPQLTVEELEGFVEQKSGDVLDEEVQEEVAEARAAVRTAIKTVAEAIAEDFRSYISIVSPDDRYRLHLFGGTSAGDSPSDEFDALDSLWSIPRVLRAIGFVTKGVVG